MTIEDKLLSLGSTHGRTGKAMTPKGIVLHYVGNPSSTALANRSWFENGAGGAYTSAHYIVGLSGEILRLIPETEVAQHAGKAYGEKWVEQAKKNNGMYIGIECCHPSADGKFNDKTMAATVELCADICKRYGFVPSKDIFRHYDVTGKSCPLYYANKQSEWGVLLAAVGKRLAEMNAPVVVAKPVTVEIATVKVDLFDQKTVEIPGWLAGGTNYVALRALMEAMEFAVGWDDESKKVLVRVPGAK